MAASKNQAILDKTFAHFKTGLLYGRLQANLYRRMAVEYWRSGRRISAVAALEKAIEIEPNGLGPYDRLIEYHLNMGKIAAASAILDKRRAAISRLKIPYDDTIANPRLCKMAKFFGWRD